MKFQIFTFDKYIRRANNNENKIQLVQFKYKLCSKLF